MTNARLPATVAEQRVQVAAISIALAGALPVFLTGAMAVQIGRDLDFGPARLGIASGTFFAAAALASAPMGRIAERVGPHRACRRAGWAGAVFTAALAATPDYLSLLAFLAAAGSANALAQVSANLLVARGVRAGRQGWALALKQAGVPAGTLLGGLAVPAIALTVGWRWAYACGAVIALGAIGAVPRQRVVPDPVQRRADSGDVPLGPLVLLAVAVGFAAGANGTLATFLVSTGVEAGFSEASAGLLLTMGSAIGISMRLLAGSRADRRGGRHLPVVTSLLTGGTLGYLLLAPGARLTHVLGAVLAFGAGWAWPGLFNLAVVRLNPGAPGAATGITQTGVYVGALTGPVVFGLVADHAGFGWAWILSAAFSSIGAVGMVVGRRQVLRWRAGRSAS